LEKLREEGMIHAERKCWRLSMGEVDWSPGVQEARDKLEVWNMVVRLHQGQKINPGRIRRAARKAGIFSPLGCTLGEAIRSRCMARRAYETIKPNARALRKDYLYDKAFKQQAKVSASEWKQALRLLREEQQREAARYLRRALGKVRAAGVDWIEEVVGEGAERATVRYTDQAMVEAKIMQNNEKRFRLTEGSPPMTEPLRSDLGFLADTDAARRILDGTYLCPPGVEDCTKNFLQSLQISEPREPEDLIPMTVSKEDYQRHWKRSREKTSSSMSGLHFGHWKAAAESNYLAEIHAMFTEIMVSTGHSPRRWQQGLSVMLEKILGCRLPEKLRAILLMEADLNFANKLFFGYRMMIKAEEDKVIPAEIVGSRKGRQAIDVALNRCLMWDAIRLKRISAIMTSADAANCYDQMAHALISLCTEWLGLQKPVIN